MATKITEKLEYLTQIHTAYDGSEQRVCLRDNPRQFITYDYYGTKPYEAQWLRFMQLGKQTSPVYIPQWHLLHSLNADVYKDSYVIRVSQTDLYNYRNAYALTFLKGEQLNGEAYKITTIRNNGEIELEYKLKSAKGIDVDYLTPLFKCYVQPESDLSLNFSDDTNATLNFEVAPQDIVPIPHNVNLWNYVNDDYGFHGLPRYYMGLELFPYSPRWVDNLKFTYSKNSVKLDNKTGVVFYDEKSNLVSEARSHELLLYNKDQIHNIKRFYNNVKGMCIPFYAPSWSNDFELAEDIGAGHTYIYVKFFDAFKYLKDSKTKRNIVIFLKNGTALLVKVNAYSYETFEDKPILGKLYINGSLGRNVKIKDVEMICFLNKYRNNSDTLQIDYETTEVANVNLTFKEVID